MSRVWVQSYTREDVIQFMQCFLLEAIALRAEAIATRVEAIATRLEAIAFSSNRTGHDARPPVGNGALLKEAAWVRRTVSYYSRSTMN